MSATKTASANSKPPSPAITASDRDIIVQALRAGVVPRRGLQHVQVGRVGELSEAVRDVERIADGGSALRFIVGDYGSGKTFFLTLARAQAIGRKLVVAQADLSPDRRLHGSGGQGRALFAELMQSMATRAQPDGGALASIVERFIDTTQNEAKAAAIPLADAIQKRLAPIQAVVSGHDFATVVTRYWQSYEDANDAGKAAALRWLRGEYAVKTEAREALGVRGIIEDGNIYDYLEAMARFVRIAGYGGLLVIVDECVTLHKLVNPQARNTNYDQILAITNDLLQSNAEGIGCYFGLTPETLTDTRRGLFSYEALRSRLAENEFAKNGLVDLSGPVIRLPTLSAADLLALLQKLRHLYAQGDPGRYLLPDEALGVFTAHCNRVKGAAYFRMPRDTIRSFLNLLAIRDQYPGQDWRQQIEATSISPDAAPSAGDIVDAPAGARAASNARTELQGFRLA